MCLFGAGGGGNATPKNMAQAAVDETQPYDQRPNQPGHNTQGPYKPKGEKQQAGGPRPDQPSRNPGQY